MREISSTIVLDRKTNEYVDAELIDGVSWDKIVRTQLTWSSAMASLITNLKHAKFPIDRFPEHAHWDWQLKYLLGEFEGLRLFGIRCETHMQGLMMVKHAAPSKLRLDSEVRLVYVDYLASAPWNLRFDQVQIGRFGQVGRVLLAAAVQLSRKSGFNGRIGLFALPQAVRWYQMQGMAEVPEEADHGLRYFETTPEVAREFLPEE